jgi:hypothetical protein
VNVAAASASAQPAELPSVQAVQPKGEPNSVVLWFQQPDKEPEECLSSDPLVISNSSDTVPISVQALRSSLPTQTATGLKVAADNFRAANSSIPKPSPGFPKRVVYPSQCDRICTYWHADSGVEFHRLQRKYNICRQLQNGFITLMLAIGGFRELLIKDVVARIVTVQTTQQGVNKTETFYMWLPRGVGSPHGVDLIMLKVVDNSDNANSNGVVLTYARGSFVQTKCTHVESLTHGVELGPLESYTDDEMAAEILGRTKGDLLHATLAHTRATFTASDRCLLSGVQEEYFPVTFFDGSTATVVEGGTDFMDAFGEAANPFAEGEQYNSTATYLSTDNKPNTTNHANQQGQFNNQHNTNRRKQPHTNTEM